MTLEIDEEKEHVPILMCLSQFPWRIVGARVVICKARRNIWISRTKCSGHQNICAPQNLGDNCCIFWWKCILLIWLKMGI
jgi:hypothetical protein